MVASSPIEGHPSAHPRSFLAGGAHARSLGRRVVKAIARAVLPPSIVVWRASAQSPHVALTFDDGPTELTEAYLSVLDRLGARATFFVLGSRCSQWPRAAAEIERRGHELASHGYSHATFPRLQRMGLLEDELARTASLLPSTRPHRMVRPPHGSVSLRSLATCARAGFTTVLWSTDSGDSRTESADRVVRGVLDARVLGGSIVLLHEGQTWTLDALPAIVHGLKEAGYELVTVGELLDR